MDELDELLAATVAAYFGHLDRTQPWRRDALCREPAYETDMFFPVRGAVAASRVSCTVRSRCAVRTECRVFAAEQGTTLLGIWGGTSGRERRGARRQSAA